MTNSKYLAGLVGPVIIVLVLSETINFHIWTTNIPPNTYLNGILLFVAGFSIIHVHNIWRNWPILITLTGWFYLLLGLYRVFFPEAQQAPAGEFTYVILTILFLVGIFLTFKAYGRKIKDTGVSKTSHGLIFLLLVLSALQISLSTIHLHVPRTIEFDSSIPYTEVEGYKFHTEIFGNPDSTPVIVVHGGPGLDLQYLKPLKDLSNDYRIIFYDQRGTGLSPRVDKKYLTMEQSLKDLHSLVMNFSNGKKVKLIGHSWGAMLVVGYLSKHPEMISQAVIVEPGALYPGAPVKEWVEKVKKHELFWSIARYLPSYPFVVKEDGQEGYDYVGTKVANRNKPGPPFNCEGQDLPPNIFKRFGYESFKSLIQPVMENPDLFTWDLTNGISEFHGDLMLISSECSILGYKYQEKYSIPKLPAQTVHIKAANMGHHMITLNPEWSLQTIRTFFKR